MRQFETGATRDDDTDKLDFNGFNSPIVEHEFAVYMNKNRIQNDGKVRDSDNWQKGIPQSAYMKSLHRHFMDLWLIASGRPDLANTADPIEALCAMRFNVNGLLFEKLRQNG